MRRLPAHVTILAWSLFAVAARGIDPDIERALREAPPPADGPVFFPLPQSPLFLRLPQFPVTQPEDQDPSKTTATYRLRSNLLHIRIPSLHFKDTPARAAFQWIAEQSVALDPKHQGVTFVFDLPSSPSSPADKLLDRPVSMSHEDLPLDEAIYYVASALNLRFDAEGGAVVIRPRK